MNNTKKEQLGDKLIFHQQKFAPFSVKTFARESN